MTTRYYHATVDELDGLTDDCICVAVDPEAALAYLRGEEGYLYEVTLPGALRLADAETVIEIARELDPHSRHAEYAWEAIEEIDGVLARLEAEGYDGVEYEDLAPDNAFEHATIRIFRPVSVSVELAEIESV